MLSPEALAEIESQLSKITEQELITNKQYQHTQIIKSWCEAEQENTQQLAGYQQQLVNAEQHEAQAKADLALLALSEPAEKLRSSFDDKTRSHTQHTTVMNTAAQLTQQAEKIEQALSASQQQLSDTQEQHEKTAAQRKSIDTVLNEIITPLETTISNQETALITQEKSLAAQQQQMNEANNKVVEQKLKCTTLQTQLSQQSEYLEQNQSIENAFEKLPLWQSQVQQLVNIQAEATNAHQKITELEHHQAQNVQVHQQAQITQQKQLEKLHALNLQTQAFTEQKQQLLASNKHFSQLDESGISLTISNLQQQQISLNQAEQLALRFTQLRGNDATLNHQVEAHKQSLLEIEQQLKQLRQHYSDKNQQKKDVETLLQQHQAIMALEEYRQKLQADEACPLCGSTEHPAIETYQALSNNEYESRLKLLLSDLEQLKKDGDGVNIAKSTLEEKVKAAQGQLTDINAELTQLHQRWQAINFSGLEHITQALNAQHPELIINEQLQRNQHDLELLNTLVQQLLSISQQAQSNQEAYNQLEREHNEANSQLALITEQLSYQTQQVEQLTQEKAKQTQAFATLNTALYTDVNTLGFSLPTPLEALNALQLCIEQSWLMQITAQADNYRQAKTLYEQSSTQLNEISGQLVVVESQHQQSRQKVEEITAQLKQDTAKLNENKQERSASLQRLVDENQVIFSRLHANEQVEALTLRSLKLALEQQQESEQQLQKQLLQRFNEESANNQTIIGQLSSVKSQLAAAESEYTHALSKWESALSSSQFTDESSFMDALISPEQRQKLSTLANEINEAKQQAQTLITQATSQAETLEQQKQQLIEQGVIAPNDNIDATTLAENAIVLNDELKAIQQQIGQLSQQLEHDKNSRDQQALLLEKISQAQIELDDLSHLNQIIGSADGAKFRRFAQGLTLRNLVQLANGRLERLYGRYQLQCQENENLALEVLDTWQGDSARDIKTLSGGESFLISLALALALSDLVSNKTSIDSLFLDEGFGTLDNDTLEVALDALDNLNASGKMIGVISHVDALKERIAVQIKVKKLSGMGVSSLAPQFAFIAETETA